MKARFLIGLVVAVLLIALSLPLITTVVYEGVEQWRQWTHTFTGNTDEEVPLHRPNILPDSEVITYEYT